MRRGKVGRKSEQELKYMRQAGRLVAAVLAEVSAAAQPGVAVRGLDNLVRRRLREVGAEPSFLNYRGYPAALCVEIEDVVVHGIPGDQRLQPGQIVGFDLGAQVGGMHADGALTVGLGDVGDLRERLISVTQAALAAGIEAARPGNRLRDISAAVQETVESAGFNVVRDLVGHGIGRSVHEPPQVPNFVDRRQFPEAEMVLRPGMTLAIEPMVNAGSPGVKILNDGWTVVTQDGSLSAHFEHTVLITESEPEILTWPEKVLSKLKVP